MDPIFTLLISLAVFGNITATNIPQYCYGDGPNLQPRSFLYTLKNQGFPDHPGALVYVPSTFIPSTATANLEIVIYVHGYNNCISNVVRNPDYGCNCTAGEDVRQAYGLIDQFEQASVNGSTSNRIFVAIEVAYDQANDSPGRWAEPNLFKSFVQELLEENLSSSTLGIGSPLYLNDVTRVQIFSHSGGYYTIGNIATVGGMPDEIRDLVLLDSLYADFNQFDAYVESHLNVFGCDKQHYRFTSIYTTSGGTYTNNQNMEQRSETWLATSDNCTATLLYDNETNSPPLLTIDEIKSFSLIYKLSSYSHDDTARNYLYQLLIGTAY